MGWKRCSLGLEHLVAGALIDISNTFGSLMNEPGGPPGAMLFWRATGDGLEFFASPTAGIYLQNPDLEQYGWSSCEQPSQLDLIVLAGKGDPDLPFLPHKLRLVARNDVGALPYVEKELDVDTA